MEYGCTLLAVKDMGAAKAFYTGLLGLPLTLDLGANVTLGGVALQEYSHWLDFVNTEEGGVTFGNRACELVFEEEEFDGFLQKLNGWPQKVELVHDVREYPWGQRVIRVFDPDRHVVEVRESMKKVITRFLQNGQSVDEVVAHTMFPRPFVEGCKAALDETEES